jgi:hypothetical protein
VVISKAFRQPDPFALAGAVVGKVVFIEAHVKFFVTQDYKGKFVAESAPK